MAHAKTRNRLLTTTAALSVALGSLSPLPMAAQTTGTPETAAPEAQTVVPEAVEPVPQPEEAAPQSQEPEAAPAPEPPAAAAPEPEAPSPEVEEAAPEPAGTEAPADPAPADENAPAPDVTTPEASPPEVTPLAPETAEPEVVEPKVTPEATPTPRDAVPEAEAVPDAEAAPETPAPDAADPAEPEPGAATETPPAASATSPDVPASDAAEPETSAPATTEAPATQDVPAASAETAQPTENAMDALDTLLGGTGLAGAAAGLAAGSDDATPAATETTTEITDADTRSSDEDFATTASGERREKDDDNSGLSNLQKVGLLALGGLAVGALMSNGDEVVSNTGDRVVVRQDDGNYVVLKDDDALLRQPGSTVRTENFTDGSTRSTVDYTDGTRVVTVRDAAGRVIRRDSFSTNGTQTRLIDDTASVEPVDVSQLPRAHEDVRVSATDRTELREALNRIEARDNARGYSLAQIRDYRQVRALAPVVDVDNITFPTGSAAVGATQAERLADLGNLLRDLISDRPNEVFLIEGHTDAVGSAASNLALSDRRAESVALALTEYFDVPPENMIVQGYGESDLRIDSEGDEPRNRRVAVRIITPILQSAQAR